jgi:tRNA nucleotidyltransferase (CCA-adding enzyme)
MSVATRFNTLLSSIALSDDQKTKGAERREAVVKVLNSHYWNQSSGTANSVYVGSWGKLTRIRPPRDVDVLFAMRSRHLRNYKSRVRVEVQSGIGAWASKEGVRVRGCKELGGSRG